MNFENAIETHYRKLNDSLSNEYEELYEPFGNEKLRILFSTLHTRLINVFDSMNQRLPTAEESTHFWAAPSREFLLEGGSMSAELLAVNVCENTSTIII